MPASRTDPRIPSLLALVERYGVECHAIGWHRARYEDVVPPHLREARDGALALLGARLREIVEEGGNQ